MNIGKYDITIKEPAFAAMATLMAFVPFLLIWTVYTVFISPSYCGQPVVIFLLGVLVGVTAYLTKILFSLGFRVTRHHNPLL